MESNEILLQEVIQEIGEINQDQAYLLHLLFLGNYEYSTLKEDLEKNFTKEQINQIKSHTNNRVKTLTEITDFSFE